MLTDYFSSLFLSDLSCFSPPLVGNGNRLKLITSSNLHIVDFLNHIYHSQSADANSPTCVSNGLKLTLYGQKKNQSLYIENKPNFS